MDDNMHKIVQTLFHCGLTQRETLKVMADCGMCIGVTKLKKILRLLNLRRRGYDDISIARAFMVNEHRGSGRLHGYRWMHEKCKQNNIYVRKEDIRLLLQSIDPEGTIMRRARRLHRRDYFSAGPNFIWHVDSYDKIKPFGFCINGCIDGFSRRIMWMNVYFTSSDPKVVCGYFIEAVQEVGCPRLVRADMGTENTCIRDIQNFLTMDLVGTSRSGFLTGPSTANQRIESFWGQLRKECMEFWLCHFHDLQNNGYYTGDFVDRNLLLFCYIVLIQDELDKVTAVWNNHLIRPSPNVRVPSGRPDVMFNFPVLYGTNDYAEPVPQPVIDTCRDECTFRNSVACDVDIHDISCSIMAEEHMDIPACPETARETYLHLREVINAMLQ